MCMYRKNSIIQNSMPGRVVVTVVHRYMTTLSTVWPCGDVRRRDEWTLCSWETEGFLLYQKRDLPRHGVEARCLTANRRPSTSL